MIMSDIKQGGEQGREFKDENNLDELNELQKQAVKITEGPLLILAGAGTGKTKVLTHRMAHILSQDLASPHNILAVTFTNKAAKEMRERLDSITFAHGIHIGTFHSICTRMLRKNIMELDIGLGSQFNIIDSDDQIKLVKNILLARNIDIKKYPPKLIHIIISRWKDQGISYNKISYNDKNDDRSNLAANIYAEYQKQMIASNVMDFGDILLYSNQLLINHPDILAYYQDLFKYIMIDEYQDTNAVQYVWARMLAGKHKNICCVGDDDQSIYSWRGADVKNILRFEKDFPNSQIIKLEQNYRSTPSILKAAATVINNNKTRHKKQLWTDRKNDDKINVIYCSNEIEEARFVAIEILSLIKSGKVKAGEVAVLVRAGFQTRAFEEVFISNAIPYNIIGGLRFYDRKEIRDALSYIRLCLNNKDNLALERIINVPKRSIGNVSLRKIKDHAEAAEISIFEAIKELQANASLGKRASETFLNFTNLIDSYTKEFNQKTAMDAAASLLEDSGYIKMLKDEKTEEAYGRLENINEMLKAIDEFDNINEFVEHSSLVMDNEAMQTDYGGSVRVMTLHAAKGLEFKTVFLPGWEEGIFPHQKALSESEEKGLEEERRIAYVGITRAKENLYITSAQTRRIFKDIVNSIPSRFLSEIPENICAKVSLSRNLNYYGTNHSFSMNNSYYSKTRPCNNSNTQSNNYSKPEGKYSPGTRVTHAKFGKGIILKSSNDNLEIAFADFGIKTIKTDYINLLD